MLSMSKTEKYQKIHSKRKTIFRKTLIIYVLKKTEVVIYDKL